MVTFHISDAEAAGRLGDLMDAAEHPEALGVSVGRRVANELKGHFRYKQQTEPNRLGGKRTNYWARVAESVHQPEIEAGGTRIRIAISHPTFRQKLEGGIIRAKRAKALTIPVTKEAYGTTVSDWEHAGVHLFLVGGRGQTAGRGLLAAAQKGGKIKVLFLLRSQVDQKPDPTALPPRAKLIDAAVEAANEHLQREGRGQ